jgi:hypothetical protein
MTTRVIRRLAPMTPANQQIVPRKARATLGRSAIFGVLRGVLQSSLAEEARTRGFAAPALAGCAMDER